MTSTPAFSFNLGVLRMLPLFSGMRESTLRSLRRAVKLRHYRRGHFFEFDLLDVQALKAARDLRPRRRRGARSLREQLTTVLS